jgi:rSAM/selenodomain-associated transferase 1
MKEALIVFVKKPLAGKVKTRLAAGIGEVGAVAIYEKLLRNTEQVIKPLKQDVFIFSDVIFTEFFDDYPWELQNGTDLGMKMFNAFTDVFNKGYEKIAIIGSDCFELSTGIIQSSFDSTASVTIGPSADGGYYLLNLTANHPNIFKGVEWSTEQVCQQTKNQLAILGMDCELLPVLTDVDDIDDLNLFPELKI